MSLAVLEATGTVLTNKYSEGYAGQALLRGPAVHRPDRDPRHRAGQGAVRRRARQRAAVLGLARQPGRLPRVLPARRHGHGHGAADGRAPHPRLERVGHRQVVPRRSSTASQRHRPGRHGRGPRPALAASGPKIIFCGGTAIPRTIDFAAFAEIAPEVGAVLVADIAHIAGLVAGRRPPVAGRPRRRDHHHHAQDPARPARRHDPRRRRARHGDRQGRVPRPAGRTAQPHHRGDRRRAARGRRAAFRDYAQQIVDNAAAPWPPR